MVMPPCNDCTPSWYRPVLRLHVPSYQYIFQQLLDVYEQVPPFQIRCAGAPTSTNKVLDVKMHCRASVIEVQKMLCGIVEPSYRQLKTVHCLCHGFL